MSYVPKKKMKIKRTNNKISYNNPSKSYLNNQKNEKRKINKDSYNNINEEKKNLIQNGVLEFTPEKNNNNLKVNNKDNNILINHIKNKSNECISNEINFGILKQIKNENCKCLCHKQHLSQSNINSNDNFIHNKYLFHSKSSLINHINHNSEIQNKNINNDFENNNINIINENNQISNDKLILSNKKKFEEKNYENIDINNAFQGNKNLELRAKKLRSKINNLNFKKIYNFEIINNNNENTDRSIKSEKEFIIEENINLKNNHKKTFSFMNENILKNHFNINENNNIDTNENFSSEKDINSTSSKNNNKDNNKNINISPICKNESQNIENSNKIINDNFLSDNEEKSFINIENPKINKNIEIKIENNNSFINENDEINMLKEKYKNYIKVKTNIKKRNNKSLPDKNERLLQSLKDQRDTEKYFQDFFNANKILRQRSLYKSISQKNYKNNIKIFPYYNENEDDFYLPKNKHDNTRLKKLLQIIPQHYGNNKIKKEKSKLFSYINKAKGKKNFSYISDKYNSEGNRNYFSYKKKGTFNKYNSINNSIMPPNEYEFIFDLRKFLIKNNKL